VIRTLPTGAPPAADVIDVGWSDRPVDEPDLASWAWHRTTGAAVAVLVMVAVGLSLQGLEGARITGTAAALGIYVLGPLVALLERRYGRKQPITPRRLRYLWMIAAVGIATLTLFGLLFAPAAALAAYVGVTAGLRLPRRWGRPIGVLVPTAALVGYGVAADVSLIEAVLLLALLVVVPTAVPLMPGLGGGAALVALGAGLPAAVALMFEPGDWTAPLVAPWAVTTSVGALVVAWRWSRGPRRVRDLLWPLAAGYLAFGSLWLLADHAGYEPAGFGPPFVELTAVHFTYAGFVATVLAGCAWRRRPDDRLAATAAIAIAGAPPFVAIGFAALGALQIVGAIVLTVGTYALAWVTLRHVVPTVRPVAAWALGASAVSVLVPMLLAIQWAIGANLGTPALSIPHMAATHGVANAVGFALLGVLGWRVVRRDGSAAGAGGDA
jgi:hypothetical protein